MERPQSIIWFERCYLASIVIGLISFALKWGDMSGLSQGNPAVAQLGPGFMTTVMTIGIVIALGINLLLWFGAARKGWELCKWFIAIFFVLGLLGTGFSLVGGRFPHGVLGILSVISTILGALSVWFLFRPDSEAWFGEEAGV
jgi:hypothetical protein